MSMRFGRVKICIPVFLLLGTMGCDEQRAEAPAQASAVAVAPSTGCLMVAPAVVEAIASTLTVSGGGTLRNARAVRSGAHRNAYFLSAEIDGSGMERSGDIATWFTNSIGPGSGMTLSVDGYAKEFSQLGGAATTDAGATLADEGAEESRKCVKSANGGA